MVATNKNTLQPLQWNVPIVTKDGTPTPEFMRAWAQQQATNGTIPDFTTGYPLHYVFAASPLGPSQPPAFRLLAITDIPNLSSLYDIAGAAAAAQAAAEAFAANASNISSGTVGPAFLPLATTAAVGVVKPDGTTIVIDGTGKISSVGGGSGGGPASIVDTGSAIELAMSDSSGQLVLDSHGNPIFMTEVFPVASIPAKPVMTMQVLKTGTSYVPTAGATWIKVRMVGGGGGGGGSGSTIGGNGSDGTLSSFNSINAAPGKGAAGALGGNGGTGGSGTANFRAPGGGGGMGPTFTTVATFSNAAIGGHGGSSLLGGGAASNTGYPVGSAAAANSGGGGSGASYNMTAGDANGGGGGGEYVELILTAANYTYAIGSGGAGGTAGASGNAGGAGGSGVIVVEEHYT